MTDTADWQAAYQQVIAEGRRRLGEPPTLEELEALARGELSGEEAARVGELLACYPELLRVVTAPVPDSDEAAAGDLAPLTAEERAAGWAAILRAADGEPAAPSPSGLPAGLPAAAAAGEAARGAPVARTTAREAWLAQRSWLAWLVRPPRAVAAGAMLLALAFGLLYLLTLGEERQLRRGLDEPRLPERRLLLPDGVRGGQQPVIVLPSGRDSFLLAAALVHQPDYPAYRVELVEGSGAAARVRWSATGVERQPGDTVEVWVPRSGLSPDPEELRVYGCGAGPERLLATYTLQLAE